MTPVFSARFPARGKLLPALAAFGMLAGATAAATPALAQAVNASATVPEAAVAEIPVVAPEVVRSETGQVGPARNGSQRVAVISLTRNVSYADLDLTRPSDVDELRNRIRTTARAACRDLEAARPLNKIQSQPLRCESNATVEAMAVANQVIAAANAK